MRPRQTPRVYPEAVVLAAFELFLILTGIVVESGVLAEGLKKVVLSPGLLITDYVMVGGVGAALVNAGAVGLAGVLLAAICGIRPSGTEVAGVLTMTGFAFFGKNLITIFPLIGGVYLYSLAEGKAFRNYLTPAMFATALAPVVSQAAFGLGLGLPTGILMGVITGFLVPPLRPVLYHCHNGLNLYNIGFTAGIVGSIVYAFKVRFTGKFDPVLIWSVHWSSWLGWLFTLLFVGLCMVAYVTGKDSLTKNYGRILASSGKLTSDFVQIAGWPSTLFNMGTVGLMGSTYILVTGSVFNGPTVGGLLTMVGFAAMGKHPRNVLPIMMGVLAGGWILGLQPSTPGVILAALFGTALAPVAGMFGPFAGFLAGIVHTAVVTNVGWLHGGMNLYNNGFAAGLVATLFWGAWPTLAAAYDRLTGPRVPADRAQAPVTAPDQT
ncbi:MAG: DUF1576 domain-containing protein [Firmicutes bacterium]|nr:DUF1576 domain-containing protein [Bacillota bacterium]